MSEPPIETLDDPRLVRALSHPMRVRVLGILDNRTSSAVEIARVLRAETPQISYHVRTLHRLGLIDLVRETPVRGAVQRFYRARPRPTISTESWAQARPVAKQALAGATIQEVGDLARAANAAGGFDRPHAQLTRTAVQLDAEGRESVARILRSALEEVSRVEAEVAEREAKGTAEEVASAGLVVMLFETSPDDVLTGDASSA